MRFFSVAVESSEFSRRLRDAAEDMREKWIAIYIAVLAVLLAVSSMMGENITKDGAKANVDSVNMWAWYQAKKLRQTDYELAAEQLRVALAQSPDLPPEARSLMEANLAAYEERVARYESDPEENDGLKELFERARATEADRD